MSLLMDALRKAEENKQTTARAMIDGTPTAGNGLALEPVAHGNTSAPQSPLPDLADHLAAVDADLAAAVPPPPPRPAPPPSSPPPAPVPETAKESVRNAFAVKDAGNRPSRQSLWLFLGCLGLAAVGLGAYFWYQLNGVGQSSLAASPPRPAAAPASAPALLAQPTQPLPPPEPRVEREPPPPPPRAQPEPPEPTPFPAEPRESATTPIKLVKTRPEADPALLQGYQHLQSGTLDAARSAYEQALKRDPHNVDALLALAAIAQRQNRPRDAERFRQLALESDPKDPAAQAATLAQSSGGDPTGAESRLKIALSAQPDSPSLNFALGNLYARQGRWGEAQQAYFNAFSAESDNPDYLFNLAVALDHLRQSRLAAQYYQQALSAGERRAPTFDRERVKARLNQLSASPGP